MALMIEKNDRPRSDHRVSHITIRYDNYNPLMNILVSSLFDGELVQW
jgi:hypothetical protein